MPFNLGLNICQNIIAVNRGQIPPQYKMQTALKTRRFQGCLSFILRGLLPHQFHHKNTLICFNFQKIQPHTEGGQILNH
jgi:hypothetical protein